jgi:glycosyltransferase involved in cell wall biosynthesis
MSERPIAYLMEQTLGNITHYLNLRGTEFAGSDGRLWLPIEYRASRLPWTITGSLLARQTLKPLLDQISGIFVHTTTLAPLIADWFRLKPTVVSCDGTPFNKRTMREAYGLKKQSRVAEHLKRTFYRKLFSRAVGFVGWSEWARRSFVEDYGCPERQSAVIPPGVNLSEFGPGDRDHDLPRLLFVGGDFIRKGGDLLLDVFRRRLRGRAELILVTRAEVPEEPGVTVLRNVNANSETLRRLYATADVFVLPTLADCFSLVMMEALASGLAIVGTRVGGISDLICQGETGFMLNANDTKGLGDVLETLVSDPSLRRAMGLRSRAKAERDFDVQTNARRLSEFVRARCESA